MKVKSHSGAKKRIKVKKSGVMMMTKSCKKHLLSNKSKRQKKLALGGVHIPVQYEADLNKLLPNK